MKSIQFFTILLVFGIFLMSCSSRIKSPTIQEIKEHPSHFSSGNYFILRNFTIMETHSLFGYSLSSIEDPTGRMLLFSSTPYRPNEEVTIAKLRYFSLYRDNHQSLELLVDEKSANMVATYGPMIAEVALRLSLKSLE